MVRLADCTKILICSTLSLMHYFVLMSCFWVLTWAFQVAVVLQINLVHLYRALNYQTLILFLVYMCVCVVKWIWDWDFEGEVNQGQKNLGEMRCERGDRESVLRGERRECILLGRFRCVNEFDSVGIWGFHKGSILSLSFPLKRSDSSLANYNNG